MKAVILKQYGTPDVLQLTDIEKPTPKDDEVLVRVFASTVNRSDCAMLSAKPFIMRFFTGLLKPKHPILGTTFAGKIEAVGVNVHELEIGQRVFGFDDMGLSAYAEFLCIRQDKPITTMPNDMTYADAAACIEGAHYARNFLNKVSLEAEQRVLVNGATGAIGSAAVQILKTYQVDITAVANTKNLELVKSLGANRVIDYLKEDFTQENHSYDFIFDAIGKSTFGQCKHLLSPYGIYISSEPGPWLQNIFFALFTPIFGGKSVIFPIPTDIKASLALVKTLMINGMFSPVIDKTYDLSEIADAFDYVETGEKTGNVVIRINHEDGKA